MSAHPVARYLPLLITGDERGLRELFAGAPRVNDPRLGWVDESRFAEFVLNSHRGLLERHASVEHATTTATPSGATEECTLTLVRSGSAAALPVAIAGDTSPDDLLVSLRIYHSMWPLVGVRLVRGPILPSVPDLVLPDVIGRYHDCLARGDLPGILEQFAPSGELREARSLAATHRGPDALRRFFAVLFANGGGIALDQCAVRDAGSTCALESVVTAWGRSPLPPQAAASVFERSDGGLLAAVRMYDDVEPSVVLH
jgi:SnoaL-like protein